MAQRRGLGVPYRSRARAVPINIRPAHARTPWALKKKKDVQESRDGRVAVTNLRYRREQVSSHYPTAKYPAGDLRPGLSSNL